MAGDPVAALAAARALFDIVRHDAAAAQVVAEAFTARELEVRVDAVVGELRATRPRVREVGALAAWRASLRRGEDGQRADRPATWRPCYRDAAGAWSDPLRAAAAREAEAREWDRLDLPATGDRCRADAARILGVDSTQAAA